MKNDQQTQGDLHHWEFDANEANDAHAEASNQKKVVVEAYGDMVDYATIVASEGLHCNSKEKGCNVQ